MKILVINCGSSSLKYQLIDMEKTGSFSNRFMRKELVLTDQTDSQSRRNWQIRIRRRDA